jgi:acetylglutamate kinase
MMHLQGRTMVIRVDEATLATESATFFSDLVFLGNLGMRPVVVAPTSGAARAVVRTMNRSGDTAVGLSGADAGMIPAAAGAIGSVQTKLLLTLLDAGYVPVIEPCAFGLGGNDVAVNADEVARALGSAVGAARAIFFNDHGGVIDAGTKMLVDTLTPAEALTIAEDRSLDSDLRAAVRAAALGVRGGVGAAQICDGRVAHAAIVEFLTARHVGTQVAGTVLTA